MNNVISTKVTIYRNVKDYKFEPKLEIQQKQEIVDNDYDLSINKYKKIEYVAKEYPSSSELIANIEKRYQMMGMQLATLKDLLDEQI